MDLMKRKLLFVSMNARWLKRMNRLGGEEFECFIQRPAKKPPCVVEDTFQTSTLSELPVRR